MKSATLRNFWAEFEARTLGGAQPAVLDTSSLSEPLFSPEDGIALASSMFAKGDLSVNIGGRLCEAPQLLPPPDTAAAYPEFVDRMAAANGTDTITFTRDYCLKYSPRLAYQVRCFIYRYVRARGLPAPGVNAVFIGGRYQATWIGLHNDYCNTFLVPAIGHKHMLLWPPPYFQNTPLIRQPSLNGICYGHINLDPYRGDAFTLKVDPGQLLYIPENWWHYNELPASELTMGLSIGVLLVII